VFIGRDPCQLLQLDAEGIDRQLLGVLDTAKRPVEASKVALQH
jgi:hypothetical protein